MNNPISLDHVTVSTPKAFRNLAVWPLETYQTQTIDYLTLDEGLKTKKVQVTEIGEAGSVPELRLRNQTDRPVLVIDGEELVGAKQNRICNITILAPANCDTVIPVSCVEAGRWAWRSQAFATSKNFHFAQGRARKAHRVSETLRESGSAKGSQGEVWNDIAFKLGTLGAQSCTDAMSDAFASTEDRINEYEAALALPATAVGAVFCLDGRPAGLELFETPAICSRLARKLYRSWALDAIERDNAHVEFRAPSEQEVAQFMASVGASPAEKYPAIGLGESVRFVGDEIVGGALLLGERVLHATAFVRVRQFVARQRP